MPKDEQLYLIKNAPSNKVAAPENHSIEIFNIQKEINQFITNSDITNENKEWKRVTKKNLINILNYLNFQDETLYINFAHLKHGNVLSIKAKPLPCSDNILECLWLENYSLKEKLSTYDFLHIHLNNNQKLIFIKPEVKNISNRGIYFNLPSIAYEYSARKVNRHFPCQNIAVELIQNGIRYLGQIIDFNALTFRIEVSAPPPQTFQWLNPEHTVYIIFKNKDEILYTGESRIIRQTNSQKRRLYVLEPLKERMNRFKAKKFRSIRHKILPPPSIVFQHPFMDKTIVLEVEELSGAGFLVEENYDNSVLLPGMIIPELYIEFMKNLKIRCKAQVIHRSVQTSKDLHSIVKCGIAILDMDIQDQTKYSGFLHQLINHKSYICNNIDLDYLWKFFFETDFVYPKKYLHIFPNKEKFKATYQKLYIQNPHIARHFIYQDKNIIQGHISMLRFYQNTWMLHHHAADKTAYNKAGLIILNQVVHYINDFHRLFSTHMNFVISYFRPENRFPNHVFGKAATDLKNPKGCSLDAFVFSYIQKDKKNSSDTLTHDHFLTQTSKQDLLEFESFYENTSGGLMINALDLEPDMIDDDNLNKEYERIGLKRQRHLFSLKINHDLAAILVVNISDFGLNMSNLTDCIHAFIISENLSYQDLIVHLKPLMNYYNQDQIPLLIYPLTYAEKMSVPHEKIYNLWVLNMQYTDDYFKYVSMESYINRSRNKEINKHTIPEASG